MSSEQIDQLVGFTGCSDSVARDLLARYDGNVERAANSFFEHLESSSNQTEAHQPASWPAAVPDPHEEWSKSTASAHEPLNGPGPRQQQAVTFRRPVADPPVYPSPAGDPAGTNAIDLTGDYDLDDDLKKAMAASLQDQQESQYVPPIHDPAPSMIGPLPDQQQPTLSEDEQLRQALEASVQTHNGGPGQEASGSGTPLLPSHLELGEHSRRKEGAPVALVPPFATLDIVAALVQAIASAMPSRHAFLSFLPVDERVAELVNYWKGVSPSDSEAPVFDAIDARSKASVDLCRRMQTLFTFMNESERSACVISDLSALTPSFVIMMGANQAAPSQIATSFYEFLVSNFEEAAKVTAALSLPLQDGPSAKMDAERLRLQLIRERASIFQSYGAIAFTSPPSVSAEQELDVVPDPGSIPVARSQLALLHDKVNCDIFSCLRAALASDGEGALITEAADVLCMSVEHQAGDDSLPPFAVEETLFLDPFLWHKRKGLRLDSELYAPELVSTAEAVRALEARKAKLDGTGDKDPLILLNAAIDYFDRLTVASKDPLHAQMQGEAAPRLKQILSSLEKDKSDTEALITTLRSDIDSRRAQLREAAKTEAGLPEWQKVPYDLQSVLVHESYRVIAYVKQREGTWWRICDGLTTEVTADEVTCDKVRDRNSAGVFWVCYQRRHAGPLPDEPCPETTKAAVHEDNLTLQSELLSLARSDAATPTNGNLDEPSTSAAAPTDPISAMEVTATPSTNQI